MKRDFLEGLGLEKDIIDKILDENSRDIGREKDKADRAKEDLATANQQLADRDKDIEALKQSATDAEDVKKQLEELQTKYTTETEQYKTQIADRDYMDAVNAALTDVKFSSKAARSAFVAALKENRLEVKDGTLDGFDGYLKTQKEADPDAFASDKPGPFVKPTGAGGPPAVENQGAKYAKQFNAMYAPPTPKE